MPQNYKVVRKLPSGLAYLLHHCGTPAVFADLPADAVDSPVFKVTTDSTAALSTVSMPTKTTITVAVAPPPPQPPSSNDDDDDDNAALVGGVVGGLLGAVTLSLLAFVCFMYSREKQGKPVFQKMDEGIVRMAPTTATATMSKDGPQTSTSSV